MVENLIAVMCLVDCFFDFPTQARSLEAKSKPTTPTNTLRAFVGIVGLARGHPALDSSVLEKPKAGQGRGMEGGGDCHPACQSTLNAQILKHGLNLSRS